MKTLREMLAEARQVVPEEGPEDLARRLKSDTPPVVIDVRDPERARGDAFGCERVENLIFVDRMRVVERNDARDMLCLCHGAAVRGDGSVAPAM